MAPLILLHTPDMAPVMPSMAMVASLLPSVNGNATISQRPLSIHLIVPTMLLNHVDTLSMPVLISRHACSNGHVMICHATDNAVCTPVMAAWNISGKCSHTALMALY